MKNEALDEEQEHKGYKARVNGERFRLDASDAWKRGWREADNEWSGEVIEF